MSNLQPCLSNLDRFPMMDFVPKAMPIIVINLVSVELVKMYRVHLHECLGGGHTHILIPMLQTKTISRNQSCAGLWLARTWFKNQTKTFDRGNTNFH